MRGFEVEKFEEIMQIWSKIERKRFFYARKIQEERRVWIKVLLNRIDDGTLKNREKEFSIGKALECETVIIEETMAARGECRSIDVTFESADI